MDKGDPEQGHPQFSVMMETYFALTGDSRALASCLMRWRKQILSFIIMNLHLNSHLWPVATLLYSIHLEEEDDVTSLMALAGQDIGLERSKCKRSHKEFSCSLSI